MATRSEYRGGTLYFFDDLAMAETIQTMAPVIFVEDFLAVKSTILPAEGWLRWVTKIVGAAGIGAVGSAPGGAVGCVLSGAIDKEEATLYWGDQKGLDVTKGLVFEARFMLGIVPSAASVEAIVGIASNWVDGFGNNDNYLAVGATGNGRLLIRADDGTTVTSFDTGITLTSEDWAIVTIDCTNLADIRIFIDEHVMTAPGQIRWAATGAAAVLQPYFSVCKASGVGNGQLIIDYVKCWQNR